MIATTIDAHIAATDMIAGTAATVMIVDIADAAPSLSNATTVRSAGSVVADKYLARVVPGARKSVGFFF
jgi:hypothetical protein